MEYDDEKTPKQKIQEKKITKENDLHRDRNLAYINYHFDDKKNVYRSSWKI